MLPTLALALLLAPAADKPPPLPADWHGTWAGKLVMTGKDDKPSEVPLTILIEPIKESKSLTWKLTYGDGEKTVVKDYKLVPTDKAGRFVIDEGGGVELPARLVNGVLYTQFETGGNVLTARYELREKTLRFEVTSAKALDKPITGPPFDEKPKLIELDVKAVQTAELTKK